MKSIRPIGLCSMVLIALFIAACGTGGGTSGTGIVSMSVTDAKPLLPDNVTHLFVEFSEVWVHKSGGGWQQLTLAESPYTIDLLKFQDGFTTELVPPATLSAGKYTQVRIVVSRATMRLDDDPNTDQAVEIPSGNLKTDKNFTIDLADGSAVDIVIHFDLSMSVVATGTGTYQMKPVIHLFDDPYLAATISGSIDNLSFGDTENTTVTVLDGYGEVYTKVEISKSTTKNPTLFSIFWLVPNQIYTVQFDLNQDDIIDCNEFVEKTALLEEGEEFFLNEGMAIELGTDICSP